MNLNWPYDFELAKMGSPLQFLSLCIILLRQVFIDLKTKKIELKIQKIDFIDLTKFRLNEYFLIISGEFILK